MTLKKPGLLTSLHRKLGKKTEEIITKSIVKHLEKKRAMSNNKDCFPKKTFSHMVLDLERILESHGPSSLF